MGFDKQTMDTIGAFGNLSGSAANLTKSLSSQQAQVVQPGPGQGVPGQQLAPTNYPVQALQTGRQAPQVPTPSLVKPQSLTEILQAIYGR